MPYGVISNQKLYTMSISQSLLPELKYEGLSTRKMLSSIPFDNPNWKPHEKSMTIQRLAGHVAELPGWISMTINTDELDFAKFDYKPVLSTSTDELLQLFDEGQEKALEDLANASDTALMENWTMRKGELLYFTMPKIAVIRTWAMNHAIHHRAQLSVYLRLNNVAVPGMYGPTADEQ
jgi:uncharacterized damage-inducible protein DinB